MAVGPPILLLLYLFLPLPPTHMFVSCHLFPPENLIRNGSSQNDGPLPVVVPHCATDGRGRDHDSRGMKVQVRARL